MLFLSVQGLQAQANVVKHKVAKGENVSQIAQKYGVTTADIYSLNPDARTGIAENTVLVVPTKSKTTVVKKEEPKVILHTVAEGETLFSIAKKYQVTLAEIEKLNPSIVNGLKMDEVLKIPVKNTEFKATSKNIGLQQKLPLTHTVLAKETKFGIAKQYGISVEELEKKNPEIAGKELPLGYVLLIKGEKSKASVAEPKKETLAEVKPVPVVEVPKASEQGYTVQPQETLFGLAQKFGCTQEELLALNPELKEGVKEGMVLKVPVKKSVILKKKLADLSLTANYETPKKVALLLPFNIAKLDQDTINSTKTRLKKDKFLNMTLDFYSGALMAIDSIQKLGGKVEVTILDSDETKSSSAVSSLISDYDLKSFHAVIGPFYQNNVERAASLLETVPVISPLSKDYDKKYPNLYQATPLPDEVKQALFDFMRAKNGNVLAIIDPKKQSVKQYLQENQKEVRLVNFSEAGGLDVAHLKSLLVAGKTNYVIMETEKTNLILSITTNLLAQLKQYDIKLVILGENEALDFEEIQLSRLTKLKMHYPSATRVNNSMPAELFDVQYKRKNKVVPNTFAIRGFDVTFDTLLRVMQDKPFAETATETLSEQIETRFNYQAHPEGGFVNKGGYILYYDNDLTIKQAN